MSLQIHHPLTEIEFQKMKTLCCQTADNGKPIDKNRWDFWGEWWIGPYEKLRRDWCWVAVDEQRVVGYLTGSPNSFLFEAQRAVLFEAAAFLRFWRHDPTNPDARRMLKRTLLWERSPFRLFSRSLRLKIWRNYPAHLHINVAEDWRDSGVGRALHEAFEKKLRQKKVPGIHVLCGPAPVPYYQKMGFEILGQVSTPSGSTVFAMGKSLS